MARTEGRAGNSNLITWSYKNSQTLSGHLLSAGYYFRSSTPSFSIEYLKSTRGIGAACLSRNASSFGRSTVACGTERRKHK